MNTAMLKALRVVGIVVFATILSGTSDQHGQSPSTKPPTSVVTQPTPSAITDGEVAKTYKTLAPQARTEPTKPSDGETQIEAERKKKEVHEADLAFWTLVLAVATIVLGAIAAVQVWMFLRQLKVMRTGQEDSRKLAQAAITSAEASQQTVATMKETAERELRAYVGVSKAFFRYVPVPENMFCRQLRAELQVTNSGRTPASNVRLAFHAEIRNTPVEENFNFKFVDGSIHMAAGSEWNTRQLIGLHLFEPQEFQLRSGSLVAVCWGKIEYVDAFKVERETTFRFHNSLLVGEEGWDAGPERSGNAAT